MALKAVHPDDAQDAQPLDTPTTPREKLDRVSLLRLAFDQIQVEISQLGSGLFLCPYHGNVCDVEPGDDGLTYTRPNCPDCQRPMRHVVNEM